MKKLTFVALAFLLCLYSMVPGLYAVQAPSGSASGSDSLQSFDPPGSGIDELRKPSTEAEDPFYGGLDKEYLARPEKQDKKSDADTQENEEDIDYRVGLNYLPEGVKPLKPRPLTMDDPIEPEKFDPLEDPTKNGELGDGEEIL